MTQGGSKLGKVRRQSRLKRARRNAQPYTKRRKNAPTAEKKHRGIKGQVKSAINKNIEQLMAARLVHDGGNLNIVERPPDVMCFPAGGPRHGKKSDKAKSKGRVSMFTKKAKKAERKIQKAIQKL